MVLFDSISEEVIKNAIKSQRISQVQNEKTILTLKELRKSSMPLGKKVDLAEDQMRDLKRQNSRTNNGDFKLFQTDGLCLKICSMCFVAKLLYINNFWVIALKNVFLHQHQMLCRHISLLT